MGIYLSGAAKQEGIPKELALFLKGKMGIQNFIETGTYMGDTTEWASKHFKHVETVEAYEKIYTETSTKLEHLKNIRFHLGDSSELLPKIIQGLRGPSLFFLDAHEFYWGGRPHCKNRSVEFAPCAKRARYYYQKFLRKQGNYYR